MTAPAIERRRWRPKTETVALQYSRARLEIDQAVKAGDWARVRDLARRIARGES